MCVFSLDTRAPYFVKAMEYVENPCLICIGNISGVAVVVVYPLPPACWGGGGGESVSVVSWGFAANFSRQSANRAATPEGSLHKSKANSVVCICDKGGRVVMGVLKRRFCVDIIGEKGIYLNLYYFNSLYPALPTLIHPF